MNEKKRFLKLDERLERFGFEQTYQELLDRVKDIVEVEGDLTEISKKTKLNLLHSLSFIESVMFQYQHTFWDAVDVTIKLTLGQYLKP